MSNRGCRKIRRFPRYLSILSVMLMSLLLPWPGEAQTMREIEPNDQDTEAMVVMPGNTVEASWSYARSRETRRGTDRDMYKLSGFTYPGIYTFTVKPSTPECKYWFGLANTRGPFTGAVTLTVKVEEQNRVTYTYSGGGQANYQYVVSEKDPLNNKLLFLEPKFWNSNYQGGFQCVKDGPVRQSIPYQLFLAQEGGAPQPMPPAGTGRSPAETEAPKEISLAPGTSWEGDLSSAPFFELAARIQWQQAAGAAYLLEVRINGQQLTSGLSNKRGNFRLADGREFPYYAESAHAWAIFYSPDFSTNNSSAAGVYEVVTDPGQAYRYRWSTGLIGGPPMKVNLKHNGLVQAPIIIRLMP
jgi:hypothetical protein